MPACQNAKADIQDTGLFPEPGPQTRSFAPDPGGAAAGRQSLLHQEVDEGGAWGEEGLLDASPL